MGSRKLFNLVTATSAMAAVLVCVVPGRHDAAVEEGVAPSKRMAAAPTADPRRHPLAADSIIDGFHARAGEIRNSRQGKSRKDDILLLAKEWGRQDAKGALQWANTLPGVRERCDAIAEIISCTDDPIATSEAIESEGINISQVSRITKRDFISLFVISLGRELGHAGTLAWVTDNMTGFEQSAQLSNVVGDAASLDPAQAEKLLKSLPAGKSRDLGTLAFVRSVAPSDPEAAARMLSSSSDPALRQKGASQLAAEWSQRDAAGLCAYLDSCPDGPFKSEMIGAAATQMAYSNPEAALSIAADADEKQKEQLLSSIYKNWARREPLEAMQNLQTAGDPESIKKFTPEILGATMLNGKFGDAGNIVKSLGESEDRVRLTVKVIETWSKVRPVDSGEWLSALGPGPSYDAGAGVLARSLAGIDPEAAMSWANTIADTVLRNSVRELIQKAQR